MKTKLPTEQQLNIIRGKMLVAAASIDELHDFLRYVGELEVLVDEASQEDFYGTEGWQHKIGLQEN